MGRYVKYMGIYYFTMQYVEGCGNNAFPCQATDSIIVLASYDHQRAVPRNLVVCEDSVAVAPDIFVGAKSRWADLAQQPPTACAPSRSRAPTTT